MSESIGTIRVDFIANLAKFTASMEKSQKDLDAWARDTARKMQRLSSEMQRHGLALSVALTAPIAAATAAAVKAADPANRVAKELKDVGLSVMLTLKPVGEQIVAAFDKARPAIHQAVGVLGVLGERFASLPEPVRITAGAVAGLGAAIGPLILTAAAATRVAGAVIKTLLAAKVAAVALLTGAIVPLTLGVVAFTAALTAVEVARWVYDEFRPVQEFVANMIFGFRRAWTEFKHFFTNMWVSLKEAALGALLAIANSMEDVLKPLGTALKGASVFAGPSGIAMRQLGSVFEMGGGKAALEAGMRDIQEQRSKMEADRIRERIAALRELGQSMLRIQRDFGEGDRRTGRGFLEFVEEDGLARKAIDWFKELMVAANDWAAGSPERVDAWRQEAEAAKALAEVTDKLRQEAETIRASVRPTEAAMGEMARIRELARQFPEILDSGVVADALRKIRDELDKTSATVENFGTKLRDSIKGFSDDAGRAFADVAFGAEVSFRAILNQWGKTLLSMAAQQLAFKPFFDLIGQRVGQAFGAPAAASASSRTGGSFDVPSGLAMGAALHRGRLVAFAGGGIVARPTLFPMARGMGLMGEAGPEAIMPLERIGGKLGVNAAGGVTVNVIDQRMSGAPIDVQEGTGADGKRMLTILVRDQIRNLLGSGALDRDLGRTYGLRRRGTTR